LYDQYVKRAIQLFKNEILLDYKRSSVEELNREFINFGATPNPSQGTNGG